MALLDPALLILQLHSLTLEISLEALKARQKLENLVRWGGGQDINHVEASLGAHS